MHDIEPYYNWRHLYIASEDERSPFYGRAYSELEFTNQIYNYVLHPQWDFFGSETLCLKILFVDYDEKYCFIELIGEWNDAINNDIMLLKRELIDELLAVGITKFVLMGENVLNFHASDDSYYEEWFEDHGEEGWIAFVNFREHVLKEFQQYNLDCYFYSGGELDDFNWRRFSPGQAFGNIQKIIQKRLQ
ncbi:MAG: hypothetical protein JST67_01600 [Bacteroidetes bacterium]|nr:hypothetical protein [Bacteroidota bacterium]